MSEGTTRLSDSERRTVLGSIAGLTALGVLGSSPVAGEEDDTVANDEEFDGQDPGEVIDTWDEEPHDIAVEICERYGDPDEVVPSRLIWHHEDDDAPWKRTELWRDPVPHNVPMAHNDYLEQFIDYHVPPRLYDEIAHYDGSVMLERTKGEVSARCDAEAMNFLAVNFTHDIVMGEKTARAARHAYAEDAMAFMDGEEPDSTQELQFDVPEDDQWDPDVEIIVDGEIRHGTMLAHPGADDPDEHADT